MNARGPERLESAFRRGSDGRFPGLLLSALAVLGLTSACVPLKPWQRAGLMTRIMQETADPLEQRFDLHVQGTREAMQGAAGTGGPSCGCN